MGDPASVFGMDGWPFWLVVAALYVIVMGRSHATYWLGRAVPAGAKLETDRRIGPRWWLRLLDRMQERSSTPRAQRGADLVHRWGPVGVAVTYPAAGLHTAVLLAAGILKMPYLRFTAASLVGSALWAALWSTVGLGAFWAITRSWWTAAALVVAVAAGFALHWYRRRTRRSAPVVPDDADQSPAAP